MFTDYTILTSNYTDGSVLTGQTFDYIFANACRHDLGSELASYHSNADYDLYFELVGAWSGNPYGLNFMTCQIGLWNESLMQPLWQWMDGTSYNWGQYGTNSSQWFSGYWVHNQGCVSVRNALNTPSNRIWEQYVCNTAFQVHCGVCNTPLTRDYKFEIRGTVYDDDGGGSGEVYNFIQLNGQDLFNSGINTIEYNQSVTSGDFIFNVTFKNYSNIGPISSMSILTTGNISIGM